MTNCPEYREPISSWSISAVDRDTPTSNPFGEMKRRSVLAPRLFVVFDEQSISPRFEVGRRVLDVVHIKLKPGLWHGNIVGTGVFAKTWLSSACPTSGCLFQKRDSRISEVKRGRLSFCQRPQPGFSATSAVTISSQRIQPPMSSSRSNYTKPFLPFPVETWSDVTLLNEDSH